MGPFLMVLKKIGGSGRGAAGAWTVVGAAGEQRSPGRVGDAPYSLGAQQPSHPGTPLDAVLSQRGGSRELS